MTTRDWSGCRSVVENSSMVLTCPCTPTTWMYSPTLKGLVKMMLSPATTLDSTPWSAIPMPRPATPMPATSGAIWKPNLSSATTSVNTITTTRTTRTMSLRAGGSSARFWSQLSKRLPTQRARSNPTARITIAPITWKPYRMARSSVRSLAERFMGIS